MGKGSAIAGGVGLVGNIIGGARAADAQKDAARRAEETARQAQQMITGIELPEIEQQKLALEMLQQVGEFTPEMLQALEYEPTAMEDISTDPRLASAQMQALEQLGIVSEGGMTDADRAAIEMARRDVDAAQTAREQAILQDMAQRGIAGSGMELALKLQSAQQAADRQNQAALDQARATQARALQALSDQGVLAGQVRRQDFGEQSDIARAQDRIREFNLRNQQRIADTNVSARNQAQKTNLATAQEIANRNVGLRNQQQQFNRGLLQQQFQNELQRAQAAAGQAANIGNAQLAIGQADANFYGGIGSAIQGAANVGAAAYMDDGKSGNKKKGK